MHTVYVLYTVRMCDVWDGAGVCIRYTICILHVCAAYGMEHVYAYGICFVYCTYAGRMQMHTVYDMYIVRMLGVCRCVWGYRNVWDVCCNIPVYGYCTGGVCAVYGLSSTYAVYTLTYITYTVKYRNIQVPLKKVPKSVKESAPTRQSYQ